jgi:phosphohistidine phosphatase SixA
MITVSEVNAIADASRHCTQRGCEKCAARARWWRRKGWRTHKNPARRRTGRK